MAQRPINPALISSILVAVAMLGVVGYMGYLYLVASQAQDILPTTKSYNTEVIAKELDVDNAKSVFVLTVPLGTVTNQQSGGVPYTEGELGKQDISAIGR
jgi:hypothetical protein